MLYRKIPATGDELSILGFGCMRFTLNEDGSIDQEKAIRLLRHAIDEGVNYVDTAWNYLGGESEKLLGKALGDGYRQKVRIATKLPQWLVTCREDMDRFLGEQLERLGVDHIDYYLMHALDGNGWDRLLGNGVLDFLNEVVRDGRVTNVGFSFHGVLDDFKRIVDAYPWTFCQIQYNFLDQENQAGTAGLEYAAGKGLGVMVMEPLRGGNISRDVPPPAVAALWAQAEQELKPVEWALRWVWNRPEVTLLLSGMNEEEHVLQNLDIAGGALPGSLSASDLQLVDKVGEKYRELMKVGCTGCGYCIPCPADVKIPACFEMYNTLHMFPDDGRPRYAYAVLMSGQMTGQSGYASQCVECGECLEKCPQHIDIPSVLVDVAREFEATDMEATVRNVLKLQDG